jgi:hypothetical protein
LAICMTCENSFAKKLFLKLDSNQRALVTS